MGIEVPQGIWLSGSTAVRHDPERNAMVVSGDLVAQADVIFEKMRLTLAVAGQGLSDLTRLVRYVTPAALPALPLLDRRQSELLGPVDVSTIVVNRLLRPHAVIEMEASIVPSQSGVSVLLPAPCPDPDASITRAIEGLPVLRFAQFASPGQAVAANIEGLKVISPFLPTGAQGLQGEAILSEQGAGLVHVSAQGDGKIEGVVAQCRDAYRRLAEALHDRNASLARVIKTTEFVAPEGLAGYAQTASVRREVFSEPFPAATGVVCEGFPDSGTLIAVEAIAWANDDP